MRNERQPIQSTHATTNQIECVKGRSPVVLPLTLADAAGTAAGRREAFIRLLQHKDATTTPRRPLRQRRSSSAARRPAHAQNAPTSRRRRARRESKSLLRERETAGRQRRLPQQGFASASAGRHGRHVEIKTEGRHRRRGTGRYGLRDGFSRRGPRRRDLRVAPARICGRTDLCLPGHRCYRSGGVAPVG